MKEDYAMFTNGFSAISGEKLSTQIPSHEIKRQAIRLNGLFFVVFTAYFSY